MATRRALPTMLAAVAAGAVLVAALPAPAMAAPRSCARHSGTIFAQGRGAGPSFRAWHRQGSLYICTAARQLAAARPTARTRRMGPWTSASRLIVSGCLLHVIRTSMAIYFSTAMHSIRTAVRQPKSSLTFNTSYVRLLMTN